LRRASLVQLSIEMLPRLPTQASRLHQRLWAVTDV